MPTSTIKPAGGGDYTTLAAWASAVGGLTTQQDAQCFVGNLGAVTLDSSFLPSSSRIFSDAGARHNGTNAGTAGLAVANGVISFLSRSNLTCEGMYFTNTGRFFARSQGVLTDNILIDSNLFIRTTGAQNQINLILDDSGLGGTFTNVVARNNVVYVTGGTADTGYPIRLTLNSDTTDAHVSIYLYNNSLSGGSTAGGGLRVDYSNTGGAIWDVTITIQNNVAFQTTGNLVFVSNGAGGSTAPTYVASNNATNDGTAQSAFGGTGNLINQDITKWWATPSTSTVLLAGCPGQDAGVTIGSFNNDIVNVTRPQFLKWDIGCFESTLAPAGGNGMRKIIMSPWVF